MADTTLSPHHDARQVAALLALPEILRLIADLGETRWTGRTGYAIRRRGSDTRVPAGRVAFAPVTCGTYGRKPDLPRREDAMPSTGRQDSSDKPRKRSDTRQRQAQVAVRLNPAEFDALKTVATREGQSLACALREGFLRYASEAG